MAVNNTAVWGSVWFWRSFRSVFVFVASFSHPDCSFAVDAGGLVFTSVRLSVLPLRLFRPCVVVGPSVMTLVDACADYRQKCSHQTGPRTRCYPLCGYVLGNRVVPSRASRLLRVRRTLCVPQRCRNSLLSVRRACIASPWCVGRPSKRRLPLSSLLLPVAYRTQSSQSRVSPCRFGLLAPDRPPRELRTAVRLQ